MVNGLKWQAIKEQLAKVNSSVLKGKSIVTDWRIQSMNSIRGFIQKNE
ncbi:hypothetical protein [Bacillus sp. MN7755]